MILILWQGISIDIIGPLPKSNRKNVIVVIVDQFTKMIQLKDDNNKNIIRRNCKNLLRQNLEDIWSSIEGS